MKQFSTWNKLMGVGAIALMSVAGCAGGDQNGDGKATDSAAADKMAAGAGQVADGAGDAAGAAGNTVAGAGEAVADGAAQAGKVVVNSASKAGDAVADTASKAGDAVAGAASNAMSATQAAAMTGKIKTAMGANASLNGSKINVTTKDNNVMLEGTVKNAAQKNAAGAIAKREAVGMKVMNNLKTGS